MTLGQRIKALRVAKGYDRQRDFAIAAGISQSLLSDIESDNVDNSKLGTLKKIAAKLEVSLNDLIPREDSGSWSWFWQTRLSALTDEEIAEQRKRMTASDRGRWAVKQLLEAFPTSDVSTRTGLDADHLIKLASGQVEATPAIREILDRRADVPYGWIETGDPGEIHPILREFLADPDLGAWLAFYRRATALGFDPDILEQQITVFMQIREKATTPT